MAIIDVSGLHKSYGEREVLHGIDLEVAEGEVVGILGPNGAGKTTLVECIGGLRPRNAGQIRVEGIDPASGDPRLRELLGMQLQQCELPGKITPIEALELFAAFFPHPRRPGELLERFGLATQAKQRFENLSGGQKQRLSVALALVGRPRVAILDELTTGLDPAARREIWTFLDGLSDEGLTILLVTHSMEEAEYLCDRVVIIDDGRVVVRGNPGELVADQGQQQVSFVPSRPVDLAALRALPGVASVAQEGERIVVHGNADTPQAILGALIALGATANQLRVSGPTLDDVYLRATGNTTDQEQ